MLFLLPESCLKQISAKEASVRLFCLTLFTFFYEDPMRSTSGQVQSMWQATVNRSWGLGGREGEGEGARRSPKYGHIKG